MKNHCSVSPTEKSHGVRSITFLFLLCLLSLNIQSCKQDTQLAPVADNSKDDVTISMANAANLLSQTFDDAAKNNVLQNRQDRQALQTSMLATVKRVKGVDYYNRIIDDAKTNSSKSWAIQNESISQYADRKFIESTKSSNGKAMALSQTFKDYLEAMRNAVVNAGNQVVDGQSNTSAVDGQVVYSKLDQSLTTLDASIRSEIRLSDDEKKVLLASTAFTRTTSNPTTSLVKSAFESSHGRGWGWFRAICNIVLTVAIIIAVTVAVAALAVAVLPVTMTVLGVTIAEGTIADAILGGGVGVLVTDAISGSYMCLFPDDGLNCN